MPDIELNCQWCAQTFVYSAAEQARDNRGGFPPPRACPECLRQRHSADAAKRAKKRPRRRNFRR